MAVLIPSLLPPPAPFKIFVLLAGVAGISVRPIRRRDCRLAAASATSAKGCWPSGTATAAHGVHRCQRPDGVAGRARRCCGRLAGYLLWQQSAARRAAGKLILNRDMIELSVVIPIQERGAGLEELYRELTETLEAWGRSYEVIVVDDGSTDDELRDPRADPGARSARARSFGSGATSARRRRFRPASRTRADGSSSPPTATCRTIRATFRRWSRSSRRGARHRLRLAQGPEGRVRLAAAAVDDRQPADLVGDRRAAARLRLLAEGVPRRGRQAAASCTARCTGSFRRSPASRASRSRKSSVNHRARRHGTSKYGISRTIRVVLDLLTVKFLLSYSTRPRADLRSDRPRRWAFRRAHPGVSRPS